MTAAAHAFLDRNRLTIDYLTSANQWFEPLIEHFCDQYDAQQPPMIVGINGCQGSGKSTLADYLCCMIAERLDIATIALSLDDFYLTRAERSELAKSVHPLLATRGVPGTHDVALAIDCINSLRTGNNTVITRFDKKIDDRAEDLEINTQPVGLIVLEGWCLGAQPQPELALSTPINSLEEVEDPEGLWRNYVNRALQADYQRLFASIDQMIMLQAPSFETVHQWRVEQERKMIDSVLEQGLDAPPEAMNDEQIRRFIQHFQRITEDILRQLPSRADHLFTLDHQRRIGSYSQPVKSTK